MHRAKEEATPAKRQARRNAEKLFKLFLSLLSSDFSFYAIDKELESLWNKDAASYVL